MRFWDASAIVPLLITETTTRALQGLAGADPAMLVWWATEVECASAIARLERECALDAADATEAFARLKRLAATPSYCLPLPARLSPVCCASRFNSRISTLVADCPSRCSQK